MSASGRPRILIVDDSRIVRATIIKRIRDRFDVREETDGEAGWEALLIDPTLQLVVTDHAMPRLDGYGLIERIRASRVARIRDVPVIMISGDEEEEARQRARDLGATDFITKGTGTAELLARLDSLVNLGRTQEAIEAVRADALADLETGLLTRAVLLNRTDQVLAFAQRHGGHVGALIIGLDRFEELAADVGEATAESLLRRFAEVLAGFVRKEDALGRWQRGQFALVTPAIDGRQAGLFAERLRGAVAGTHIEHAGHALQVTVSIGVASFPADGEGGEALAAVAEARMAKGMAAGGNRIEGGDIAPGDPVDQGIDEALACIATGRAEAVRARLPELGRRLLPLLSLLEKEYGFELPTAEMERRLAAAEAAEKVSTT